MSLAINEGRRETRKRETRRALHEAALRLAIENGFHETTIADITAAAGVAPRTFFAYFPTKEAALYGALEDFIAMLEARLSADNAPVDALDVFRSWVFDDVLSSGELAPFERAEFRQVAAQANGVAAYGLQYRDRVASALADGLRRQLGCASNDTLPETAAAAVVTGMTSQIPMGAHATDAGCIAPSPADLMTEVDRALAFARAGIAAVRH